MDVWKYEDKNGLLDCDLRHNKWAKLLCGNQTWPSSISSSLILIIIYELMINIELVIMHDLINCNL